MATDTTSAGKITAERPALVALGAVALLAAVSAAISYSHMLEWARVNGDSGVNAWRGYLFPLSVDGSIVAASAIIYADARAGRRSDWLAYSLLGVGIAWSVVANVGHDWVSPIAAKLIAGWVPVSLAASVELLLRFIRRRREQAELIARKAEQSHRRATPRPVEAKPATEVAEEVVAPQLLRATGTEGGGERPDWMPEGATIAQAMKAYLVNVNPEANGVELDSKVGVPIFGAKPGYGRRIVREFRAERES